MHYFWEDHPHNGKQEANDTDNTYSFMEVALLSLILGLGTAFFALMLRSIRYSPFCFSDKIRSLVTDFAITMSVALFTLLQQTVFTSVQTEELNVPDTFAPTFQCCDRSCTTSWPEDCPELEQAYGRRPWLVDLFDLNGKTWAIFMAAGPAALAFILAFLDNGITWHIVNNREYTDGMEMQCLLLEEHALTMLHFLQPPTRSATEKPTTTTPASPP